MTKSELKSIIDEMVVISLMEQTIDIMNENIIANMKEECDNIIKEGANLDMLKEYRTVSKSVKLKIKSAKLALKKDDKVEAKKYLKEARTELSTLQKNINKIEDTTSTVVAGFFLSLLLLLIRSLIPIISLVAQNATAKKWQKTADASLDTYKQSNTTISKAIKSSSLSTSAKLYGDSRELFTKAEMLSKEADQLYNIFNGTSIAGIIASFASIIKQIRSIIIRTSAEKEEKSKADGIVASKTSNILKGEISGCILELCHAINKIENQL